MQTLVAIWLAGGTVCTLAYLVGIWPAFREYARWTGFAVQVLHYGPRAIMIFVAWPFLAAAFLVVAVGGRS